MAVTREREDNRPLPPPSPPGGLCLTGAAPLKEEREGDREGYPKRKHCDDHRDVHLRACVSMYPYREVAPHTA